MEGDVEIFIKKCDDCQRYKHSRQNKEPLRITTTASSAFQKVFLDLVGPLDEDEYEDKYILTLQCELTKFVECYPLKSKETLTVTKAFVESFLLRYGIPEEVATVRGTEFLSEVFKESCKMLKINSLNSTAYHHQSLGALENTHKTLRSYLRIQCKEFRNTWSTWVPYWAYAYNNTVHCETKFTPHELVFGKTGRLPSNMKNNIDPLYNLSNYPLELKYRLQVAWQEAKRNLIECKTSRKQRYDVNAKELKYSVGDKVLLKNSGSTQKCEPIFVGPYSVVRENNPNVTIKVNNKEVIVHKDRIKHYFD